MLTQLSLNYSKQYISRFMIDYFSVDNEGAYAYHTFDQVFPFQETLTIVGHEQNYRIGTLLWGKSIVPHLLTVDKKTIQESAILTKHFHKHRCLILVNGFYLLNSKEGQTYFVSELNDAPLLLAGIYYTSIINNIKTQHVSILSTTTTDQYSVKGLTIPVILNKDQYRFWLNPQTIPSELNFLLLPDNFKRLKFQTNII
jgi:putative SOS response-associated peptidase YedK